MNTSKDDADFDPFAHDKPKKAPRGAAAGAAWVALLLALAVAGYNGFQWWQARAAAADGADIQRSVTRLQTQLTAARNRIDSLESSLAEDQGADTTAALGALRTELTGMNARVAASGVRLDEAEAGLDAVQAALLIMQQRLDGLETAGAALAARTDAPGQGLDVAEAGYLLRLAEERLGLFGDIASAESALAMADAQLAALENPLYQPVRRRIAEARQALQAVEIPDAAALAARLSALQDQAAALPFPGEQAPPATSTGEAEAGVWQRIKAALSPLVTVRRRVDDAPLGLADQDLLRQALWLQLESARLALMRGDDAAWQQSLSRARATLENEFDARARAVRSTTEALAEMQSVSLQVDVPDISRAWDQLRLLRGEQAATMPATQDAVPAEQDDEQDTPAAGDEGG
ncbi:MAG: hypothetical protein HKN58_01495 [Xanthomonadales bacterium]|nr:hypothetical protein [Xanthomonadales bacterium]